MTKQSWIIALDNSPMDVHVLKYTKFISQLAQPDTIRFLHVAKKKKLPPYVPEEYQNLQDIVLEDKRLAIQSRVTEHFGESRISHKVEVKSGSPFHEIIEMAMQEHANLVIAGRKLESSGSGVIGDNLSRNLPGDFLLVPENVVPKLDKILVSTDFSDHSTLAMQRTLMLTSQSETQIVAHHSYAVPMGYSKSGKSFEEFADIMKGVAENEMARWLKKFNRKIESILTLQDEDSVPDQNLQVAKKAGADMIVVGSKGQSSASRVLLGSHTLKLVKLNHSIPTLIVKKEGENLRILDALKEI